MQYFSKLIREVAKMNAIKIANGSQELEFKNWQEVASHFTGKNTPVSSKTATAIVNKNGWEVISVEKTATSKSKSNIIESLLKQLNTIDKDLLKSLMTERDAIAKSVKTSQDAKKLIEINLKINDVSNPVLDKSILLDKVALMYDEYMQQQENEKA